MSGQKGVHGPAQKRGVVTRHRRDHKQLGLGFHARREGPLESEHATERLLPDDLFRHGDVRACHAGRGETEGGLPVAPG